MNAHIKNEKNNALAADRSSLSGAAWLKRRMAMEQRLIEAGAYSPEMEHDACGVGLVAAIDGKPRRDVVEKGIEALQAIWHRGAVDADGKTGDGAGIHLEIPLDFFREHIARTGHEVDSGRLAVGMVFLPRTDMAAQERCRCIVEEEILKAGYSIYGWRQVPVDVSIIGEKASATRPEIEQIMFSMPQEDGNLDVEVAERDLYVIRRKIENAIYEERIMEFYLCSFSSQSIIYKGMFLAEQVTAFYPDLLMNGLCHALRCITSAIPPIHSRHGNWLNLSVFLLIMVKLTRFAATVTGCSVMKTAWHHHFSVTTFSISSLLLKMAHQILPPLIACLNSCFMQAVTCRWLKPCLFQKRSLQTHRKTCVTFTAIATQ